MGGGRDIFEKKWIKELSQFNECYLSELSDTGLNKNLHLAYEIIKNCI